MLETNTEEALLMSDCLFFKLILPSLILTIALLCFLAKVKKHLKSNLLFLYTTLFFTVLTVILTIVDIKDEYKLIPNIKENKKELGVFLHHKTPLVFGDAAYLLIASYGDSKYSDTSEIEKLNNSIIAKKSNNNKSIILIMGESSLFSRYSAYGYHLNTTPHMAKIFSTENACIVNNVHSSAPITRDSVSMTLAFNTPESEDNLFSDKSIVEMARYNGYKTYWLGSQEIGKKKNTSTHGSKYGFIARKSDYIKLTNYNDNKLVFLLSQILSDNTQKRFIVIHLFGNHKPYNNYDEIDKKALPKAEKYDLTISHTDRIVNDIFNVINEKKIDYNLIYTSDHGEVINVGHGLKKGREQYLIPFMYKSTNSNYDCHFIESFRNKDGYLSGLMNKYILSELLGYKIDKNVLTKEREYDRVLTANEEVITFSDIK
ncbi:phosphoethanolamine transferase [Candidatus Arsenophonus triatominarum]|uniref:phosphoethanolamine transferase n=1 Tax=Candidatus Arsenophonus triatominarum TaxID=57911 RepID=UPI001FE0EF8B|nr:phosphoethanolamine transferase [Candidatus Arsenophonus triatominarum]